MVQLKKIIGFIAPSMIFPAFFSSAMVDIFFILTLSTSVYDMNSYLDLDHILSTSGLLLAKGEKAIEFMIPTPRVPTVSAN
jgi:hypothetical protein